MQIERKQGIEPDKTIKVDLHLHTWCSDGVLSPREVLESAAAAGIRVVSITDHETAGGYLAVKDEVPGEMKLIFGVEFSTYSEEILSLAGNGGLQPDSPAPVNNSGPGSSHEIHILGYFPAGVTDKIEAFLKELQQERVNRAKVALVNLRKHGCRITFEQLMEHVHGDCISRAHIARALIANNLVSSAYDAFSRYLSISRGIVPPPLLTPRRAISFIESEGGIPVWAHPEIESFDLLVKKFVDYGLKGVEICNHKRTEAYSFYFERTARVLGLYVTYGSDWHGIRKEKLGGITVAYEAIAEFLAQFK